MPAQPAHAADLVCDYATTGSGPYADTICWIVWDYATIAQAQSWEGARVELDLAGGGKLSFTMTIRGGSVVPATPPLYQAALFGNRTPWIEGGGPGVYYGFDQSVGIYQNDVPGGQTTVRMDNIVATDSVNDRVYDYSFLSADAEVTNAHESLIWTSSSILGSITNRGVPYSHTEACAQKFEGEYTQQVICEGADASSGSGGVVVLQAKAPNFIQVQMNGPQQENKQGTAFGVLLSGVGLNKTVAKRYNDTDSFRLSIKDVNDIEIGNGTTGANPTGTIPLVQTFGSIASSKSFTFEETAEGTTDLSKYDVSWSCERRNSGGPTSFSPTVLTPTKVRAQVATGDTVTCTATNTAKARVDDIAVTKAATPIAPATQIVADQEFLYTVTATNKSSWDISGATVTDTLPQGITATAADQGGTVSAGQVTWANQSFAVGEVKNYTFRAKAAAGGTYMNVARVTTPNTCDDGSGSCTGSTSTTIGSGNNLKITKKVLAGATPKPGELVTYQLQVVNSNGQPTTQDATVTDDLPAELRDVTIVSNAIETTADVVGNTLTWPIPRGTTATQTVTVQGRLLDTQQAGTVDNTAQLSANCDSAAGDCQSTASFTVTGKAPDIKVTKSGPDTAAKGSVVSYSLKATNLGDLATVRSNVVTDILPPQFDMSSITATGATAPSTVNTQTPGQVLWTLPAGMPPGAEYTVTITGKLRTDASGTATNTAEIPSTGECSTQCKSSVDTTITDTAAALSLTKASSPSTGVHAGQPVTYTFTVTNVGQGTVSGIKVTDPQFPNDPVTCAGASTIASLAPKAAATCTLTHTFTAAELADGGSAWEVTGMTNTASASGTDPNGVPVESSPATATTKFTVATDTTVTKTATATQPLRAGSVINYKVDVAYNGDDSLTGWTLDDPMLPDLAESCSPPIPQTIAKGFKTSCTGRHTVTEQDIVTNWDAGAIKNTATFTGTSTIWPDKTVHETGTASVPLDKATPFVELTGSKVANPTSANPTDTVTYTVKVKNAGQLTATDVVIEDSFKDAGYQAIDPDSCTWPGAAGTLKPGAEVTCTYPYVVTASDASSTLHNTVQASATDPSGTDVGPSKIGEATVTVSAGTELWAEKAPDAGLGGRVRPGMSFGYTITVHNDGPAPASGQTLTDKLPDGLVFAPATQNGWSYDAATGIVKRTTPFAVPAGGTTPLTFTVQVDPDETGPKTYKNIGAIDGMATPDGCAVKFVTGCFEDKAGLVLDDSDITWGKSNNLPNAPDGGLPVVKPNDTFTYTVTAYNSGTSPATVTAIDVLPTGLAFEPSNQSGWTISGNQATSTPFVVAGGGSQSVSIGVKVLPDAPVGTALLNVVAQKDVRPPADCVADPTQTGCAEDPRPPIIPDHSKVTISKSNSYPTGATPKVKPGDTFTYTVTATNSGTQTARAVRISDTLPDGLEFTKNQPSGVWTINAAGTTATLTSPVYLKPGASNALSWDLSVRVSDDAPAGFLRNVAVMDDQDPGTCVATPTNACGVDPNPPFVDLSNLTMTKKNSVTPETKVRALQQYSYEFVVTNSGTEDATDVTISDKLPAGIELDPAVDQSATWRAVDANGVVTSTKFTVAKSNGTKTLTLAVRVKAGTPAGTVIQNTGVVGDRTPPASCVPGVTLPGCAIDPDPLTVDDSTLKITKTNNAPAPRNLQVGDPFTYTITVENLGSSASTQTVTVVDQLPAGLAFNGSTQKGWADLSGQTATSVPVTIKGGETANLTLAVKVVSGATAGSKLTNVAAVEGMATPQQCLDDSTQTLAGCAWDDSVTFVDHSAVTITKTSSLDAMTPPQVKPGGTFTYTLTVTNTSDSVTASGVKVTDTLPQYLQFAPNQASGWTLSNANRTATLAAPITLGPKEPKKFDLVVQVTNPASGTLRNVATLDDVDPAACTGTPLPWGCAVHDTVTVNNTDVRIAKANNVIGNRVKPLEPFRYTFTLTNMGSEDATGVTVTDLLPAGLEVYPASQAAWGAFDADTRQLTSTPITVPKGGTPVTIDLDVRVLSNATALTQLINAGSIDGTTPVTDCLATPTATGCAVDPKPLIVDDSVVTLSKTNDIKRAPVTVQANDSFTYTITVRNDGTAAAQNVVITDELPAGLAFDGPQDGTKWTNQTATTIQSLPMTVPGKSATPLTLKVKVLPTATVGEKLTNVTALDGTATTEQCRADLDRTKKGCAWDDKSPLVVDHSSVTITKQNDLPHAAGEQPRVVRGQQFTYTITATNASPDTVARGVLVTETLPAGLSLVSSSADWQVTGGTLTTSIDVPAGGSTIITMTVLVQPTANGTLRNVVVKDTDPKPDCTADPPPDGCDPWPPYVDTVVLTKVGSPQRVHTGDAVTYTFTATNIGTEPVSGYQILDSIPPKTTLSPNPQDHWTIQSGTGGAGTVVISDPMTVAPGSPQTVTMTVLVDKDAPGGKKLLNVATMKGGRTPIAECVEQPAKPDCVSDTVQPIVDDSTVTLTKTNDIDRTPVTVQADDTFTYFVVAHNGGATDATGQSITDLVPDGLQLLPNQDARWRAPVGQKIQSFPMTITPGVDIRLPLTVKVLSTAAVNTTLVNVAAVDGVATPEACRDDDTRTMTGCAWDDAAPLVVDHSAIKVTKSNSLTGTPPTVKRGQSFSYTVRATNTSSDVDARKVTVSDTLPTGLAFGSQTDARWQAPSGQTITSQELTIPKGGHVDLTLVVTVTDTASGTLRNVAVKDTDPPPDCDSEDPPDGCDPNPPQVDTVVLSKKADQPRVKPGGTVTYTFTADNSKGAAAVTNYQIIESIPEGVSLSPLSQSGWNAPQGPGTVGTIVTSEPFTVPAGEVILRSLTVVVDQDARAGQVITNVATMASGRTPIAQCVKTPSLIDCVSDTVQPVVDDSDVTIEKSNDITRTPRTIMKNESFTYYVTVKNNGAYPASGVTVTDMIPDGLAFDGQQDSVWQQPKGQQITSTKLDVVKGAPQVLPLKVKLVDASKVNTVLVNVAAIDGAATPEACAADSTQTLKGCAWDKAGPTIVDHSDVTVTKSNNLPDPAVGSQPRVTVGDTFRYSIIAANASADYPARDVIVTDTLPAGLTYVRQPGDSWTLRGQNLISDPFDIPAGGSKTMSVTVQVAPGAAGTLRNVVVKDADQPPDCTATTPPAGCDPRPPYVDTVKPSKTSSVPDGARVKPGDPVTYTFTADNRTGASEVANYGFIDQVPTGMLLDSISPPPSGWRIISGSGGPGTVLQSDPVFTVPARGEVQRTLTMRVDPNAKDGTTILDVGTVVNGKTPIVDCVATPTKPDCYQEPTDHAVDDSTLQIVKSNDVTQSHKLVRRGGTFTYRLEVSNLGASQAQGITVSDELPAGLMFAPTQDSRWNTPKGQTIQSKPFAVDSGAPVSLPIAVVVTSTATGTLTNYAAVDSMATIAECKNNPNQAGCAIDKAPVRVDNTDLSATKTASVGTDALLKPGQSFSYTITAVNKGTETATDVTVYDKLPAGIVLDPDLPSPDFSAPAVAGVVQTQPVDLAPNVPKVFTLHVKVDPDTAAGTMIRNVGSITKADDDGPTIGECVADPTLKQCFEEPGAHEVNDSVITLTKSNSLSDPRQVLRGDQFSYQIVASNSGLSRADKVTVSDTLPDGLVFDGQQDSAWGTPVGQTITSGEFSVGPKSSRTLTLRVKVTDAATIGSVLRNVSVVAGTTPPATCLTDPTADGCGVDPKPPTVVDHSDAVLTKTNSLTGTTPRVVVGDTFFFTLTASNPTGVPMKKVLISDTLPAGIGLDQNKTQDSRWQQSSDGRTVSYLTDLAPGEEISLRIYVVVLQGASGVIQNVGEIDGGGGECDSTPKPPQCDPNPPEVDNVTFTKSSGLGAGARVKPTQKFAYTFTVTNSGKADKKGYVIVDQIPVGLQLEPSPQAGWTIKSGTGAAGTVITSDPFDVKAGQTITKTLSVMVPSTAKAGTVIENVGTVQGGKTPIETCVENPTLPDCVPDPDKPVVDDSDVVLRKTNSVTQSHKLVRANDTFQYRIEATNKGAAKATDVQITDLLPLGLEFEGTQDANFWQTPTDARTIQSKKFDIPGGETVTLTLKVKVAPSASGKLVNASAVDGKVTPAECLQDATRSGCGVDIEPVTVDRTVIEATKTASVTENAPVKPGQAYSYEFVVRNSGGDDATGVTVTDQVPVGVTWQSSADFPRSLGGGVVVSRAFDLPSGASETLTMTVVVDKTAVPGTVIHNIGAITKDTDDGPSIDECVANPKLLQCVEEKGGHTVDDSNITIEKSNGLTGRPPLVTSGQTFTYDLIVRNSGKYDDPNVRVTDLLPDGLSLEPASQEGWSQTGALLTHEPITLKGGSAVTLHVSVKVKDGLPTGTWLRNVSAVAGSTSGGTPVTDCDTDGTKPGCGKDPNPPQVVDHSAVEITKINSLTDPVVVVGDTFSYTIKAWNKGQLPVKNVLVTDTLPAGLALAGIPAGWQIAADGSLYFYADIDASKWVEKSITVTVVKGASGVLKNQAVKDDEPAKDCDATPRPKECDPNPPRVDNTDVKISKASNLKTPRVKPNQEFAYTFTVTNEGTEGATGVSITDTLPRGLSYVSKDGDGWTSSSGGRTVTSTAFDVGVGEVVTRTLAVKVDSSAKPGDVIENTGCTLGLHKNVCGTDPKPPVYDDSKIQLAKSNDTAPWDRKVRVGDVFRYTITATNTGTQVAENVTIVDTLPSGLAFEPTTSQPGWASVVGGTATSPKLRIDGRETVSLTLTVKVTSAAEKDTKLVNVSAVDGETDPATCRLDPKLPGCGVDPDPPTVVDLTDDVSIAKKNDVTTANKTVQHGDSYVYTITVTNKKGYVAHDVPVFDTLPAGLVFDGPQSPWTIDGATASTVIDAIGGNKTVELQLRVKVADTAAAGELRNVSVLGDTDPPTCVTKPDLPGCGVDPDPPTVDPAKIVITKANNLGTATTVKPGQSFQYTITVTNKGGAATNIKVREKLPVGLEYVGAQDGWDVEEGGPIATATIPSLAADTSTTRTLTVKVKADAPHGLEIKNAARVQDPRLPDPQDPEDCKKDPTLDGCAVDPKPPLVDRNVMQIEKSHNLGAGALKVSKGQKFSYTITVRNTGFVDATGVTVQDRLPAGLAWASTAQSGWSAIGGVDARSAPVTVPAGGEVPFTIEVIATKTSTSLLRNIVALTSFTISGDTVRASGGLGASVSPLTDGPVTIEQCVQDPNQAGCAFDDVAGTGQRDGVVFTKKNDVTSGIVKIGGAFSYTITASNKGDAASNGITISDTLPAGLTYAKDQDPAWTIDGTSAVSAPFDLAPGTSKSLTLKVVVGQDASGVLKNIATMDDRDPDDCAAAPSLPGCAPDSDPPVVDPGASVLRVEKKAASVDVNRNGVMDRGDTVSYSFVVTNTGDKATDAGLEIVDPMLQAAGIAVVCPTGEIQPGASVTCRAVAPYVLTQGDQQAGKVRNVAVAAIGSEVSRPAEHVITTSGACAGTCPTTLPVTGGGTGGTGTGTLPHTGGQIAATVALSLALLGAGALAIAAGRKRRRDGDA